MCEVSTSRIGTRVEPLEKDYDAYNDMYMCSLSAKDGANILSNSSIIPVLVLRNGAGS